jgi:hypothetical protein
MLIASISIATYDCAGSASCVTIVPVKLVKRAFTVVNIMCFALISRSECAVSISHVVVPCWTAVVLMTILLAANVISGLLSAPIRPAV